MAPKTGTPPKAKDKKRQQDFDPETARREVLEMMSAKKNTYERDGENNWRNTTRKPR